LPQTKAVTLALESVDFFMRNIHMRLPFRYGNACLVASPILHARLRAKGEDGREVTGVSADLLIPKWFDKDPAKNYRQNIEDLIAVARVGVRQFLDAGSGLTAPYALWFDAYHRVLEETAAAGYNGLTGSFGSTIIERAVIDAACQLGDADYHSMVHSGRLGIDPGAVHEELAGMTVSDCLPSQPLDALYVRHTVGLGDPILDSDIPESDRLGDGIPQSLEAWVKEARVRYFKVKVCADLDADMARLAEIARLLDTCAAPGYGVSLDANEQFKSGADLAAWLEAAHAADELRNLLAHLIFIEQPMERGVALSAEGAQGFADFADLPPVVIDESDDSLDAFKRSVELGYRGTSVKNCKGVFKGILNRMLVEHYNRTHGSGFTLTGEDLSNQPIVALQQDLCTLSVLGVPHAERNGHHYCGTLDHVSSSELNTCLVTHGALYESFGKSARLRIRDGAVDLRSLRCPGYGLGIPTDFGHMTPLDDWDYDSLGVEGM
jgi:hypothetical protein